MNWTEDQLKLALALYCQLPFGKMHSRHQDVIRLAEKIGRTPSAVAMKLVNFASLDPEIVSSGRKGLGNASSMDRKVWEKFQNNWDAEISIAADTLGMVPDVKLDDPEEVVMANQSNFQKNFIHQKNSWSGIVKRGFCVD